MKKVLFLIAITMMAIVFNGCKNEETVKNPLIGNWVVIGEQEGYEMRFEGVEFYLNLQDDGKMVQYVYNGEKTDAVWDNGVLSGESWIAYETYTWKNADNTISFSPSFWGIDQSTYKITNNDILGIEGVFFGRVKQLVTTK